MANEAFPHKSVMEGTLGATRSLCDGLRDLLANIENRVIASMADASDEEICYVELWLRQVRDRLKEIDKKAGHVREVNAKRALHQWYPREDFTTKLYGHTFRLDFHIIPSLPKAGSAERATIMAWLKANGRADCIIVDETGEEVFVYDAMEKLVNDMLANGDRPPAGIKLHPQAKIQVRADK